MHGVSPTNLYTCVGKIHRWSCSQIQFELWPEAGLTKKGGEKNHTSLLRHLCIVQWDDRGLCFCPAQQERETCGHTCLLQWERNIVCPHYCCCLPKETLAIVTLCWCCLLVWLAQVPSYCFAPPPKQKLPMAKATFTGNVFLTHQMTPSANAF